MTETEPVVVDQVYLFSCFVCINVNHVLLSRFFHKTVGNVQKQFIPLHSFFVFSL